MYWRYVFIIIEYILGLVVLYVEERLIVFDMVCFLLMNRKLFGFGDLCFFKILLNISFILFWVMFRFKGDFFFSGVFDVSIEYVWLLLFFKLKEYLICFVIL